MGLGVSGHLHRLCATTTWTCRALCTGRSRESVLAAPGQRPGRRFRGAALAARSAGDSLDGGRALSDSGDEAMRVPSVVGQEPVYSRYLSVFNRRIKYPASGTNTEQEFEFDVVGHPKSAFHFVCVFPVIFVDGKPQVTLIREYCWGPDAVLYSLPTGGFDPKKHADYAEAAKAELSEEARLCGGELVRLLPEGHPGISEGKWCLNRFTPFLVINPQVSARCRPHPRPGSVQCSVLTPTGMAHSPTAAPGSGKERSSLRLVPGASRSVVG
mmetsp:Transcript_36821/g.94154  ORF Transcript_36821/g.94154 Transcript_36821/m.94154 type:complete len:270 (-) Transcript_36821:96-905(-)